MIKDLINRLDKQYTTSNNPNFSIIKIIIIKVRVLILFFFDYLINFRSIKSLEKLNDIENMFNDKVAIVLGNGKEVSNLPFEEIRELQKLNMVDIFGVNFILNTKIVEKIDVNNLVLSDPFTLDINSENSNVKNLWENIIKLRPNLFLPHKYFNKFNKLIGFSTKIFYFNDFSLESICKNINPKKPRGYPSSTSLKALALTIFSGYKKIYICGMDNSMFLTVKVMNNNKLIQYPNHIENTAESFDITNRFFYGFADYLFDFSNLILSYSIYFKFLDKIKYVGDSYLDIYDKISINDLIECVKKDLGK